MSDKVLNNIVIIKIGGGEYMVNYVCKYKISNKSTGNTFQEVEVSVPDGTKDSDIVAMLQGLELLDFPDSDKKFVVQPLGCKRI